MNSMKSFLLGVVFALLLVGAAIALVEGVSATKAVGPETEGIPLGKQVLEIGMTKEKVFEMLDSEFRFSQLEPDFTRPELRFWGIARKGSGGSSNALGDLTFDRGEELVGVWKNLKTFDSDETRDLAYALISSLGELSRIDNGKSKLSVNPRPEGNSEICIRAGARTISLMINDSQGGANLVSLTERLNPIRD
jgi:hypothetical protein